LRIGRQAATFYVTGDVVSPIDDRTATAVDASRDQPGRGTLPAQALNVLVRPRANCCTGQRRIGTPIYRHR
jgi:hypothetical protein